ncbi:MAG: hypothetical protein FGM32_10555 [Candidatus Kapabacteria bacterium]|nr:hypothetical protein [Candidatus Kapabacteria bacterium]
MHRIPAIIILLLAAGSATAQQYSVKVGTAGHREQQMTVGYGLGGAQNAVARNVLGDSTLHAFGPLWLSYTTELGNRMSVGAEVGYHETTGRWLSDDTNPPSGGRAIPVPYSKRTVHLAAHGEVMWHHARWFDLASGASLGIALFDHNGNNTPLSSTGLAYHISLVSVRVAGDVAFRLEIGYGYRGIVNVGMSFVM